MEDSTTMTIEFLRARLLSERSVSRTARQRADELAKRVAELEKQLKSVNLQRKKAEQATVEVLAILENNGIGDFLEMFDSNSDQERVHCESKEDNNSMKEEQLSNSELEGSSLSGRSLSWKSCSDSPNSLGKKCIDQANRRRSSFGSTSDSSAKPRVAKSCRQIKRRETISAEDNVVDESIPVDDKENGVAIGLGDACNCHKDRLEILKEGSKNEVETVFLEDQRKETNDCDVNECRRDAEMKRAIENNTQLMDRYKAEENAQREWEDKFRENSSCTPDSCEHGNCSDITEEMDELRETVESTHTIPSLGQGVTSEVEECRNIAEPMTKTLPNDLLPTTCLDTETQISFAKFSFLNQESSVSTTEVKQIQEWSDSSSLGPSEHRSTKEFSSFNGDVNLYKGESSRSKNGLQMTVWHEPPNDLGGVLEELQRAKLSLKHELNRLPLSVQDWAVVRMTETSRPAIKPGDGMEIPIGCAGLFRVPTDSQFEATTLSNLSGPHTDSGSSLTRYYPSVGVAGSDQYTMGSINSTQKPYFDPYVDVGMGLTTSSRYTYPSSYADLAPIMPSNDRVRRLAYSSIGSEVPAGDRYSAYYDQTRSNVHHR